MIEIIVIAASLLSVVASSLAGIGVYRLGRKLNRWRSAVRPPVAIDCGEFTSEAK